MNPFFFLSKSPEWKWIASEKYPKQLKKFIVIEGTGMTDFLKAALLKDKPVICELQESTKIYYFPEAEICICTSTEKDLNSFGMITEKLNPWISVAEDVIGLTIQPQVFFKGDVIETECLFRGINSNLESVKELEEPNIVTGVCAGVVSWRKFKNLSSSCYIIYMRSPIFDSISAEPILKLLKHLGIPCDNSYSCRYEPDSSLYM